MSRSDSQATQRRLLEATGRLLERHHNLDFNLTDTAREAGVSPATVYRYFRSKEEAVSAYVSQFADDVVEERAKRQPEDLKGTKALYTLGADYVGVCELWGPSLVHIRSPLGFLARRRDGDRSAVIIADMAVAAIVSAMDELKVGLADLNFALMLWNGIFDPRQIFELRDIQGWSAAEISEVFTTAFIAAVRAAPAGSSGKPSYGLGTGHPGS